MAANFAPATSAYNIKYSGEFKEAIRKYDLAIQAAYFGPQLLYNYFGIGNNTEFDQDKDIKFYRVRFSRLYLSPTLNTDVFSFIKVGFGPQFDMIKIDESSGGFVRQEAAVNSEDPVRANETDFTRNRFLGIRGFGNIESVINPVNPRLGIRWLNELSHNWQLNGEKQQYTHIGSQVVAYFSPPFPFQLILAYRLGGAHNYGEYQFYQANTLGGTSNLRGFRRTRFAGRSSVYQNVELRCELFKFNIYLFPGKVGLLGLWDAGRVFSDNDETKQLFGGLHHGVGGGIWTEIFSKFVISGTYAHGEESLVNLTFGFLY